MSTSEALSLKGACESPWKERDQSTGWPVEETGAASGRGSLRGRSSRPVERERWFVGEVRFVVDVDVLEVDGGDAWVWGADLTGIAGLGGATGLDTAGLAAVDVAVAAVLVVGRVKFTYAIEELEKYRERVAPETLRAVDSILLGEEVLMVPMSDRTGKEELISMFRPKVV
jgi:hypothetical protein